MQLRRSIPAAPVIAVLALTAAAGAAEGDPYLKSCYATGTVAPCVQLQPPFTAADAELSPDGKHVYAAVGQQAGAGYNGLRTFTVGASGTLTPDTGAAATTQQAPTDVDVSPDGKNVYVSAGNQLLVLNRDTGTGALAQAQCFGEPPCGAVTGTASFAGAAVSPDGSSVYVRGSNQLLVFDRDIAGGGLSQKSGAAGCLAEEVPSSPCSAAVGIAGSGIEIVVSPDGRHVYAPNESPGGVAVFGRDTGGTLTQQPGTAGGCITTGGTSGSTGGTECSPGLSTLAQARAVNVDAQGGFVIVSGVAGNTVFRRDRASGRLTETDCLDELGGAPAPAGCHEVKGATGGDAAFTPEGDDVVLNAAELGLSFFAVDRGSGKLTQRSTRGCLSVAPSPPCAYVPALLGGFGGLTVSQDGLHVFAAFSGGTIASIERDAAPACRGRTVTLRRNTTVLIPLACTDANGDRVTLEIAAPPANGTLGIVDTKRQRVAYSPEDNYTGRDSFAYRGRARGTRGAPATIGLRILARGRLVDRTPPNTRIRRAPAKATTSATALFTFTATERTSRFECKLDRQRYARCRSPKRYTGIKPGRHTFRVRAVDRAGNTDLSPAIRTWVRRR
jgi:DNA-binding beta-propeller fold protein YncE